MKLLRIVFLVCISCNLFSQQINHGQHPQGDSAKAAKNAHPDSGDVAVQKVIQASDTGEIPEGVIYVRKPHINPFIKVDYKLFLSRVMLAPVEVPVGDGIMPEIDTVPIYDSAYYKRAFYVKNTDKNYPVKSEFYAKYFAENLHYQYSSADTPRVDTLTIGMEILSNGKVKYITPYTELAGNMPKEMLDQLTHLSMGITSWGTGGGYQTKKKFLKPIQRIPENYYCEIYVIVSSYPLTQEQKNTGMAYSPFDYPLNSPTMDEEQKASLKKNH